MTPNTLPNASHDFIRLIKGLALGLQLYSKMKLLFSTLVSLVLSVAASPALEKRAQVPGIDISGHTTGVNFQTVKANGIKFVYIKATEGTGEYQCLSLKAFYSLLLFTETQSGRLQERLV